MMTATEMTGIRTAAKIEFNPRQNMMGKVVRRPWLPPRHREQGEWLREKFLRML